MLELQPMIKPAEQLRATLRKHSYSLTVARREVFAALQEQEPQTMSQLVERCQGVDRASVYRCVALFGRLGIVKQLHIGWKHKLELTEPFSHHHHHLTCVRCDKIIPLPEDRLLERRLHALAHSRGFVPQDHQLEIRGWCDQCSKVTVNPLIKHNDPGNARVK